MNGRIDVHSEVDVGSTFSVSFSTQVGRAVPIPQKALQRARPQLGFRVLVAEDNPVNRKVIDRMLTMLGCQAVVVEDGKVAALAAERGSFDCILMDCQMPVMDGYQATIRLRSQGASLPIIALTAHALVDERSKCLAVGMNDVLCKPISLDLLGETLIRWCTGQPPLDV